MKDKKNINDIYYKLSFVCYLIAISFLTETENNNIAIIWMLIGSTLLCLASVMSKKNKEDK